MLVELNAALLAYELEREKGVSLPAWFDGWWTTFHDLGLPMLLSRSAVLLFDRSHDPERQALWRQHLPQSYQLVPVERRGFAGTWVLPRPGR
jgi:hypothetical protein